MNSQFKNRVFRYLQLMDEQDQIERDLRYLLEMKGIITDVLKICTRNPLCKKNFQILILFILHYMSTL